MKTQISLFLSLFLVVAGCKEVDKLTQFSMDYSNNVTIPSSSGVNLPFSVFTPPTETDSESKFEVNDTRKDLIEEIMLTELELTLTSPSDGDFSFLESIRIFIEADGLDGKEIAWNEDVPDNVGNTLQLNTSNSDLQAYIKKESFRLRITTVTDETLNTDHDINVRSQFFVDAKVLGQ